MDDLRDALPLTDEPPARQIYDLGYCPVPDCPNFGGVWRDCPLPEAG